MHDVVVIGAGPGGSATASFLARAGFDVVLLDKSEFPRDKTCGDGLTPRALSVLDELGLLEKVNHHGYPIRRATVYSPNGTTVTTDVPERDDLPSHMLTIPRLKLDDIICEQARNDGANFRAHVHVKSLEHEGKSVRVSGQRLGKRFTAAARIVVIAVGANVRLLINMGILKKTPDMILAARAYFEDIKELSGHFEFHFDGVPIPGYGWIFPISHSSANIGAGILRLGKRSKRMPSNGKTALKQFLQLPRMKEMLAEATPNGPIKGFPLRTDFATAPTFGERVLLVGESAGLVNPLTGEGVDFALESAKIAAQHLAECFAAGDLSRNCLRRYDRKLRANFQRMFRFSTRIRNFYLNEFVLNRLVYVARRRVELREMFTDVVLGNVDAARAVSLKTILQLLLTR